MAATTQHFHFPLELYGMNHVRATMFNSVVEQLDTELQALKQDEAQAVVVRNMLSDVAQAGAPPGAVINGDAWVVDTWGAGNYVGTYVGAYADGDIAEYNDTLGGWVRVLANVGGVPPTNALVLVKAAGGAGSFAGQANNWAQWNGQWVFTAPTDGERAFVAGEQSVYENRTFAYDQAVAGWYSTGVSALPLSAQAFVDKLGNDDTGTGTIEEPYLTIAAAYAAYPTRTIVVGPGIYTETLVFNTAVRIQARIPGTVTISGTVAAGAVVTVSGAAVRVRFSGINITNLSAAGAAAIALHVDNTGATVTGPIVFEDGVLTSGAGVSRAFEFTGAAGGGLRVDVKRAVITGTINVVCANAADLIWHDTVEYVGGAAAWFNVTGNVAAQVWLSNFLLPAAAAGETLDFGGGAACAVVLGLGSGVIAGTLALNNLAGAGGVVMTAGTQLGTINALQANQVVHRWYGEDELGITAYHVDANAIAPTVMYTVGAGRRFNPHTVRTINRGAATGAVLNYRYNGTGNGSVVAAVGAGALAQGIANEAVVQDSIAPAGTLVFDITAASGAAGDFVDAEVIGRLF